MPELVGSRKPRQALAAIAASAADPPFFRISTAASVASGCAVPAAPERPKAAEREAKLAPDGRSPAWSSGRTKLWAPSGWNFGNSAVAALSGSAARDSPPKEAMASVVAGTVARKVRRRIFGPPWGGWRQATNAAGDGPSPGWRGGCDHSIL